MSRPERPVYRATITNVSQGWTETIEHRETPPEREDVETILMDGFTMTWGLESRVVPAKLAAESVAFKLYASAVEYVPALEAGDLILVNLDRPGPGGTLIPYMHGSGRAADPDATTIPGWGIQLSVNVMGFTADLSDDVTIDGFNGGPNAVWYSTENLIAWIISRQIMTPNVGGYNTAQAQPWRFPRVNRVEYGTMPAQDVVDRALAGTLDENSFGVLRYAYGWDSAADPDWATIAGTVDDVTAYVQPWLLNLPAPLTLLEAPDHHKVVLGPQPASDEVTTLSASLVETPTDWSKSRADLVNVVNMTAMGVTMTVPPGGGFPVPTEIFEKTATFRNEASIARYGPVTRDVTTYADFDDSAAGMAGVYMNSAPETITWSVEALEVRPDVMDDDELDQLAPLFYPHAMPLESIAGRFLILTDIDDETAIAGTDVAMQIIGCTFAINQGKLTITPALRAMPQPDFATSITFNDLAATPLADTTFVNTGAGHYIDPALDVDELTYTDI